MVSKKDVIALLRELERNGSTVVCVGEFCGWKLRLRAKISAVRKDVVYLSSLDGMADFSLRLDLDDLSFKYGESQERGDAKPPAMESGQNPKSLWVYLPVRMVPSGWGDQELVPRRDSLLLCTIPDDPTPTAVQSKPQPEAAGFAQTAVACAQS
jgi:hypothetical protein